MPKNEFWEICIDAKTGAASAKRVDPPEATGRALSSREITSDLRWTYSGDGDRFSSKLVRSSTGEVLRNIPGWHPFGAADLPSNLEGREVVYAHRFGLYMVKQNAPEQADRLLLSGTTALLDGQLGTWAVRDGILQRGNTAAQLKLGGLVTELSRAPGGWILLFTKESEKSTGRGLLVKESDLTSVVLDSSLPEVILLPSSS